MSDAEPTKVESRLARLAKRVLKVLGVLFVLVFLEALCGIVSFVVLVPGRVLYGWIPFVWEVFHRMTIRWDMVAVSIASLALATWGTRRLLAPEKRSWKWVCSGALLLVVLFCTSIASVGVVHQVGWLFRTRPWIKYSLPDMTFVRTRSLARDCIAVAKENGGEFPESLLGREGLFVSRNRVRQSGNTWLPFVYLGAGLKLSDPKDLPLLMSPTPTSSGDWVVVTLDGEFKAVEAAEREAAILRLQEFWTLNRARFDQFTGQGKE